MKEKVNITEIRKLVDKETCPEYKHKSLIISDSSDIQITPCCDKFGDKLKIIIRNELKRQLVEKPEKIISEIFQYPNFSPSNKDISI